MPNKACMVYCPQCGDIQYAPLRIWDYKYCPICGTKKRVSVIAVQEGHMNVTFDDTMEKYLKIEEA